MDFLAKKIVLLSGLKR